MNLINNTSKMGALLKSLKKQYQLILLTLPAILYLLILKYIPILGNIIAFKRVDYSKGFFGGEWVGFFNFKYLFQSGDAWQITRNTVMMNLIFILTGTIISLIFAMILSEVANRALVKFYQTSMFLPHFLSWVVVGYIGYAFMHSRYGILNNFLENVGMARISFYSTPQLWPIILTFFNMWHTMGVTTIIYYAGIMGIEKGLYEASEIDGATKMQKARYITLPSLKSLIIILVTVALGKLFTADFGLFYFLPKNSGMLFDTTQVIDTYVYRALKDTGDFGMGAAAGLYQSVIGFVLILATNTFIRKVSKDEALF